MNFLISHLHMLAFVNWLKGAVFCFPSFLKLEVKVFHTEKCTLKFPTRKESVFVWLRVHLTPG